MTAHSVHGALLLTQLCWGSAAVVNKLGLSGAGISPLLFALIREATATPFLILILVCGQHRGGKTRRQSSAAQPLHGGNSFATPLAVIGRRRSAKRLLLRLLPGFFIFVDQLCSLTGTALADGVTAAAWQPSQVVFTLIISVVLGMEAMTVWKLAAVCLTVCGALCLVFLGGPGQGNSDAPSHYFLGQAFFAVNCLASSLEVVIWRLLLSGQEGSGTSPFAVMAESYLTAAVFMVFANVAVTMFPSALDLVCPACGGDPWHVPGHALYAIGYSVVFQTIVAYCAQAWALQFAPASLASLYATAQPIMAAAVTCLLLVVGMNPGGLLRWPGREYIGAAFIIGGLVVAEFGARRAEQVAMLGESSENSSDSSCCEDAETRRPQGSSACA